MILVVSVLLLDGVSCVCFDCFLKLRCWFVNEIEIWIYSIWYMKINHLQIGNFVIHIKTILLIMSLSAWLHLTFSGLWSIGPIFWSWSHILQSSQCKNSFVARLSWKLLGHCRDSWIYFFEGESVFPVWFPQGGTKELYHRSHPRWQAKCPATG
jgi:hypothetical protein